MKWTILFMSITVIFSGCASMNNTGKGAAISGGPDAASDTILGGVIGRGKDAAIGATIGTVVGAGVGALIGRRMDKVAAEAKQVEDAQAEQMTDNNGLQAVKVTLDLSILFATDSATLSAAAKSALNKFASNALNQSRDMDVSIHGYTGDQGRRNSAAEQSRQKSLSSLQERVQSVTGYLLNYGVSFNQIKGAQGMGESDPTASNDTTAGREQNRRVEVYTYTSEQMIKDVQVAPN